MHCFFSSFLLIILKIKDYNVTLQPTYFSMGYPVRTYLDPLTPKQDGDATLAAKILIMSNPYRMARGSFGLLDPPVLLHLIHFAPYCNCGTIKEIGFPSKVIQFQILERVRHQTIINRYAFSKTNILLELYSFCLSVIF